MPELQAPACDSPGCQRPGAHMSKCSSKYPRARFLSAVLQAIDSRAPELCGLARFLLSWHRGNSGLQLGACPMNQPWSEHDWLGHPRLLPELVKFALAHP